MYKRFIIIYYTIFFINIPCHLDTAQAHPTENTPHRSSSDNSITSDHDVSPLINLVPADYPVHPREPKEIHPLSKSTIDTIASYQFPQQPE